MSMGKATIKKSDNGEMKIVQIDYDVPFFGGADYEAVYKFDSDNAKKLYDYLVNQGNEGTIEAMIAAEFGESLEKVALTKVLEENGIKYEIFTWIS